MTFKKLEFILVSPHFLFKYEYFPKFYGKLTISWVCTISANFYADRKFFLCIIIGTKL